MSSFDGIAHERAFIGPLGKGCNEFGHDCGRGAVMAGLYAAFATRPHDAGAVAGAMAPDADRAQEICVLATRKSSSRPCQQPRANSKARARAASASPLRGRQAIVPGNRPFDRLLCGAAQPLQYAQHAGEFQ